MRSPVAIFVLLLAFPAALAAQSQHGSWSDVNGLKAGQGIEIIEFNMKRHAGEFINATEQMITLKEKEKDSDVTVRREDVARVSTSSRPKRGEHAIIGLVVGAGIGAAIGAASGSSTGFLGGSSRGITALVGLAVGGPSGAVVGAVLPAATTIYRAAPPPHMSRGVPGKPELEGSTTANTVPARLPALSSIADAPTTTAPGTPSHTSR